MIDRKEDNQFHLVSKYEPSGDQPQAIETLVDNIKGGEKAQILKGATGTGKTYTMSQVIQRVNKPTLVIAHNKTLAGQLYGEFKEFFPDNAVEYFVSYYDYYQPEAYVPSSDTYIEKDSSINDEIDKLRHSATSALLERNDVIVVASVSCIYGLGSPKEYADSAVSLRPGQEISRDKLLNDLVDIQFERNDIDFQRGKFRVRGDVVEIFPASRDENAFRVEFFGDEIDRICEIESLTGRNLGEVEHLVLFPATHFMTNEEHMEEAIKNIMEEMEVQVNQFEAEGKLIEAQRIRQRTEYDVEMLREMGYTNGIENYSRHMDGRKEGEPPFTLLDFFPEDFLIMIDESHMTMGQIKGMYNGDQARKKMLVDYGFRLPSALDNRPLRREEFESHVHQIVTCVWVSLMFLLGLTFFVRVLTFLKLVWLLFWMLIRKVSFVMNVGLSKRLDVLPEIVMGTLSCMRIRLRSLCRKLWMKLLVVVKSKWPIIRSTVLLRKRLRKKFVTLFRLPRPMKQKWQRIL